MAQTGGGATLVGTVKDATGAAVGAAKVTVVNLATSFIAETTTSPEGAYYVPYLAPGDYRMKVSSAGFKEFVREGITLRSAEVPRSAKSAALGRQLDPAAFVVHKAWVGPMVLVVLDDPDDPTPYWLVSCRHPERVLSALRNPQ